MKFLFLLFLVTSTQAAPQTVIYKEGTTELEGYLAKGAKSTTPQPAVLIVHDWMGNGEFTREKAQKLSEMGYVGFAVDIYGKGVRPKNSNEAAQLATEFKSNRARMRARIQAAYEYLKSQPGVDASKIAVMGYCFGGTTALELARSGVPLAGAVSFHGGLESPTPQDAKNIKGKVLVLHGADDPFIPPKEVEAFKKEMSDAKVAMRFIAYPGAVHSFTNPKAGNDNAKGAAYQAKADQASWKEMKGFFRTVF